ncbi:MAG: hypothetical protein R8G01_13345 [Ilumatobacteraceae bacterium]|nr:hypothetical protein [Ilumatobacteraceae bacterium]
MAVLGSEYRKQLENVCVAGRREADAACRAVLEPWDVWGDRPPAFLTDEQRLLRRGLRARSRQLGDTDGSIELLVAECAYEQWHRLLFARFLAENRLLVHPEFGAPVSLAECEELAESMGEPDGWSVAARFAAEILPGIFGLDDPAFRLRLTPDGLARLEALVASLPAEVFVADDALGWVYQYWQRDKKDEVNASERKIGGADLGPVTQLFTENYMVRFLLENSLGAWWAARHPDSSLLEGWEFLRFDDDGNPAAGSFDGWPETVGEVTVMDPCCGSGHFLVEAFGMLWQMRAEEEGLDPVDAQDAVLRDNLFGLELDPRCVQIAMFAVALSAWKAGGGWRELPTPHIACSGIPVKAPVDDWKALARGDERLENALVRLHILFRDADTLGSLIDPKRVVEITDPTGLQSSFEDVDWDDIQPLLDTALTREAEDPATSVLGADAAGIARAADYLSRHFTLICTNPPFLAIGRMDTVLRRYANAEYPEAKHDLSTVFLRQLLTRRVRGQVAMVLPENWMHTSRYEAMRRDLLGTFGLPVIAWLGARAFETDAIGTRVRVVLAVVNSGAPEPGAVSSMIDTSSTISPVEARQDLALRELTNFPQASQLQNPDARILSAPVGSASLLSEFADSRYGLRTGDSNRLIRKFWELGPCSDRWRNHQSTVRRSLPYSGREHVLDWSGGEGALHRLADEGIAALQGHDAWGRRGIAVALTGELKSTLYEGTSFDNNCAVVWPMNERDLPTLWAFCSSLDYNEAVRNIDDSLKVMNATLLKVPFEVDRWRRVAEERFPDGLPEPWSDDPTQWLFEGRPEMATEPLQVAVGRLLRYRWPEQAESDHLDELADDDGIVCLPSVLGERSAADRLQELLARAFGGTWSPARTGELLERSGSRKTDLASWLRDDFFKQHCKVFQNRPFIWHVWDGRKDGFSALVNYHRLDAGNLQRLTYSYLNDWIERQQAAVQEDVAGADDRLAAAQELQRKLVLILEGEPPYDIYVRWKELHEQAIGWDPDLNDGVRLNVRPFVEAGVLRSSFNVHWRKDRGKNPDGNERHNDLHCTIAEKQAARGST